MIPTITAFTIDYAAGLALFAALAGFFWTLGGWCWSRLTRGR